jgi:hypothetical protein
MLEMLLESIQVGCPEVAVRAEPVVDGVQGFGLQAVDTALVVDADGDQAGLAQDAQVFGDGGLSGGEGVDELADGPFGVEQKIENAAPSGLGEHGKGRRRHARVCLACLKRYITVKACFGRADRRHVPAPPVCPNLRSAFKKTGVLVAGPAGLHVRAGHA